MKIAGLEFGFGSISSMTSPPVTLICVGNENENTICVPLIFLAVLFLAVCFGTFAVLLVMQ